MPLGTAHTTHGVDSGVSEAFAIMGHPGGIALQQQVPEAFFFFFLMTSVSLQGQLQGKV